MKKKNWKWINWITSLIGGREDGDEVMIIGAGWTFPKRKDKIKTRDCSLWRYLPSRNQGNVFVVRNEPTIQHSTHATAHPPSLNVMAAVCAVLVSATLLCSI